MPVSPGTKELFPPCLSRRSFSEGGTCLAKDGRNYSPLEGGWGMLSYNKLLTLSSSSARPTNTPYPLKGGIYLSFPLSSLSFPRKRESIQGGKILFNTKRPTPLFLPLARQVSPLKGRIYLSFPFPVYFPLSFPRKPTCHSREGGNPVKQNYKNK